MILLALIYIVCAVGAFDIFYYVDLTAVYGHIAFKFVLVKFLILLHQELLPFSSLKLVKDLKF